MCKKPLYQLLQTKPLNHVMFELTSISVIEEYNSLKIEEI